jgi:uncharacterized protein
MHTLTTNNLKRNIETKDIPDVVANTQLTHANLHQYVYSLPVSSLCSGCLHIHELEANVKYCEI